MKSKIPERLARQKVANNEFFTKVRRKLEKVRARGYITKCKEVKAYTNYFPVHKTWRSTTEEESKRRVPRKRRKKTNAKAGEVEGDMNVVEDIRMVYDATSSSLNDAFWAPWSPMPTVETLLRAVEGGTYMADCDIGEMFSKFYVRTSTKTLRWSGLNPLVLKRCYT